MSKIVVVGAGLAGLSTACRLLGRGHDVTLLEQGQQVGGAAGRLEQDGFAFDTGPTVLTMPELIDDTLRCIGSTLVDRLTLRRLEPAYRGRFADGSTIDVHTDPAAMRAEIARSCGPDEAARYEHFARWVTRLYELEFGNFIDVNYRTPLDLFRSPVALARLVATGGFGRLGPAISRRIKDPRLQRLLSFQALYVGLAPAEALAIYAVISYMDSIAGVWFPDGGMHAVPEALAAAFTDAGGVVATDQRVRGLITDSLGRVAGVRTADDSVMADAVVCTGDPATIYRTLLGHLRPPRRLRTGRYSPSAVVWHLGVRGVPGDDVRHHNIHFGKSWEESFTALNQGRLMPDPSRLVTVPSLDDPRTAPDCCSTLYVLEPVPNAAAGIDWRQQRMRFRERLGRFLEESGYPVEVITEKMVTPQDWADQGWTSGTPFALAHSFGQTGPFRPPNHERRIPGLFFAGSGTVPGVGVPMVIISGRLAAERVDGYVNRNRDDNRAGWTDPRAVVG
ncbi:NAD(P)/FAD-dependent oxidoreductase [Microlunatus sp. Gsoil 973]|uniref:phytoene desaturase family protein n=1 Tax=Microlunatus sp. Gsoil 973 TaxID=2672569 RepID=UPI0012B49CD3|nr:phytoene desaturase family protein [Microlunatus sp. Gsoil 973]QGN34336.1 phytoene desaturase [Microlunatus sp. Gsoil 973]